MYRIETQYIVANVPKYPFLQIYSPLRPIIFPIKLDKQKRM